MSENKKFDVVIVGGGLVGASLACALRNSNLRVCVIEAHKLDTDQQPCYDDRTVALSYGSRIIFEAMGLWETLSDRVEKISTIHISDRGHFGATRLRATEESVEALGYVAENRVLGEVLYQYLDKQERLEIHCPATIESIEQSADDVTLHYSENGESHSLRAGLLVAADGVSSRVRELMQIGSSRQEYHQTAVITNVTPGHSHNNVAYERFTDTGPLAFLPMTQQRCSVVWTVGDEQAKDLMSLSDTEFLQQLQQRFGYCLGRLKKVGQRQQYPLALVESTQLFRGRVVIAGNAAHTLHPVAGQGFNLALRDVALLAELMVTSADVGALEVLQSYVDRRQQDAQRVYRFTDALVKVFSNNNPLLGYARASGLVLADLLPAVKHGLARQSMGLSGRASKLSRGISLASSALPDVKVSPDG